MKLLKKYLNRDTSIESSKEKNIHYHNYKPGNTSFQSILRVRPLFLPESIKNSQVSVEVLDHESIIFRHEHD